MRKCWLITQGKIKNNILTWNITRFTFLESSRDALRLSRLQIPCQCSYQFISAMCCCLFSVSNWDCLIWKLKVRRLCFSYYFYVLMLHCTEITWHSNSDVFSPSYPELHIFLWSLTSSGFTFFWFPFLLCSFNGEDKRHNNNFENHQLWRVMTE